MRFAICNETYQGWELGRICEHAAACGYDGVEVAPFTLDDDPRRIDEQRARSLAEAARAAGIEIVGLHWLLVKPEGLHVTTPDGEVRRRTVEFLRHLARLCAAMGGKVLVLGSPRQRNVVEGQKYEDCFARAAEACRAVCETAAPLGVALALEPLAPSETNFLTTAAEAIRLIEAVDHPACRLHLDVKAMASEGRPIPQIIADGAAHLAHFHANDANRRGPGFGEVDFVPIAAALKQAGYDGTVSVEVFDYEPDPQTIAERSLAYLKKTFSEAGAI
ncbi:MAG: D-tagatose 3-epimerase [Planctomycetes bacterium DG_20]|nr:MAG: D-tagatose 3-epimerase [Planctomycetes bacterium DG_20]